MSRCLLFAAQVRSRVPAQIPVADGLGSPRGDDLTFGCNPWHVLAPLADHVAVVRI
ncbi:MAG: hypothetical protein OXU20_33235 [Myxococcales bacterium]|nr:hypothetical protein [Myxococcales bacterium]